MPSVTRLGFVQMEKIKVAFICVHNSCRSQIAEALCRLFAGDIFDCYSAGTEIRPNINDDALRLVNEIYGVDMKSNQFPKLLSEIPPVDVVVTMGCNVECPFLPCRHRFDWDLDDPTGKDDREFTRIINAIEEKIKKMATEIELSPTV